MIIAFETLDPKPIAALAAVYLANPLRLVVAIEDVPAVA